MRKLAYAFAAVALVGLSAGAWAGSASKFAANVKDLTIVPASTVFGPTTVLTVPIKTGNKKDLLVGVSFETGLFTQTEVKSKGGNKDTSSAEAALFVSVFVDGQQADPEVFPKEVIYDKRLQALSAILGGVIEECTDTGDFSIVNDVCVDAGGGPDGTITVECECVVTDEEIELILDTMAAHHFNFVVRDLSAGDHVITVKVEGTTDTSAESGSASANVTVGNGSLTVEEVRATNQDGGIVFE